MTALLVINFFAFCIAVFLGTFVYHKNPKNPLNRLYLAICLLDSILVFIEYQSFTAPSYEISRFWYKAAFFWPFSLVLILHFCLVFTDYVKKVKKFYLYLVLYLPAIPVGLNDLFDNIKPENFVHTLYGWIVLYPELSITDIFVVIWSSVITLFPIILGIIYYCRAKEKWKKRQSIFILLGVTTPALYSIINNIVLPGLGKTAFPFDSFVYLISTLMLAYGIWKYELFVLTPARVAEKILSTIPDMIFLTDTDGKIHIVNQAVTRILGYVPKEIEGMPIRAIFTKTDRQDSPLLYNLDQLDKGNIIDLETTIIRKNGRLIPVSLSSSREVDEKGFTLAFILVCRDISDRKNRELERLELHKNLQIAHEELKRTLASERQLRDKFIQSERLASLGQIGAKIAHEINNPLTFINGEAQLGLRKDFSPALNDIFNSILYESNRIREIALAYIDLSRPTELKMESLDINEIITGCLDKMKFTGETKYMGLTAQLTDNLPFINGDKARLIQALRNIVINAVHAVENRPKPEILISSNIAPDNKFIEIKVRDNGCGINPDDIEKIFNLYFTTRQAENGTGLGLAVVKEIIEHQHKGKITVTSLPGQGTEFTLLLPIKN